MLGQGHRAGARAGGARTGRLRRDRGRVRRAGEDPAQGRADRPPHRGRPGRRAGADRAPARGRRGVRAARARPGPRARARARRAARRDLGPRRPPVRPARDRPRDGGGPGITTRTHTRVDGLEPGEGVRLAAAEGASRLFRADEVVLAAGPWSAELARTAGLAPPARAAQRPARPPDRAARHPPQGGRRRLPRRGGGARGRAAGLDRDRDDARRAVLVGSSRERKGSTRAWTRRSARGCWRRRPGWCPR